MESLVTGARRSRVTVQLGPTLVEAGGRQTLLDQGSLDADLAFDLSRLSIRDFRVEGEGVKVSAHGTVSNLCKPRLGLEIAAEAPIPAIFSLARVRAPSSGSASVKVQLSGPAASPDAAGQLQLANARIGPYTPGDARAVFRLRGDDLELSSVEVPFPNGAGIVARATVRLGGSPTIVAEAESRQVEFAELLSRLGLTDARVMMKLDSKVKLSGPLSPLRLAGQIAVDAQDFRVIDRSWVKWKPGLETVLDLPRGRVEAPVVVDVHGVEVLEGGKAIAGDATLGLRGNVSFEDARGFDLALDGGVDLTALRHIASVPMAGKGTFKGRAAATPYGPPRVEGALTVRGFHFLQLDLGEVNATALATPDLVLMIRNGEGRKAESSYTVETTIDLGATPIRILPSQATARGRMRDLFDVVMPWLPTAKLFQDAIDGSVQLTMPFEGDVPKVNMGFQGTLGRGKLWGREFDWGRIGARVVEGEKAVIHEAELHRGEAMAEGKGTVHFESPSPWNLSVEFAGLPLDGLDLPGDGWGGTVDGDAEFGGTVEDPVIRFSATGDEVRAIGVPIGAVDAEGVLRGRRLELEAGTAGAKFRAVAELTGAMPYEASAEIDVEDLTRFLPGGPPAGLRAQAHGRASAKGNLEEVLESQARLELDRVRVGYADFRVGNKEPMVLTVARQRMAVESFTLEGTNTEFSATGARARSGELDFTAAGTLDLRLLGGLLPAIVKTHGRLTLDAAVSGTLDEPLIVGGGRLAEAGFRFRELPIEFAGMAGELTFSQNLVLFERLASTVNGAPTQLRGEVGLQRFVPSQIRIEADLDRVPVAIPSWLPTVLSGKLEAFGSLDAMTLAGTLRVVSARYTEPFDLDKRMLQVGAAPGRSAPRLRPHGRVAPLRHPLPGRRRRPRRQRPGSRPGARRAAAHRDAGLHRDDREHGLPPRRPGLLPRQRVRALPRRGRLHRQEPAPHGPRRDRGGGAQGLPGLPPRLRRPRRPEAPALQHAGPLPAGRHHAALARLHEPGRHAGQQPGRGRRHGGRPGPLRGLGARPAAAPLRPAGRLPRRTSTCASPAPTPRPASPSSRAGSSRPRPWRASCGCATRRRSPTRPGARRPRWSIVSARGRACRCSGTTTTPTSPEGTWAPTSSFAGSGTIEPAGGPRGAPAPGRRRPRLRRRARW